MSSRPQSGRSRSGTQSADKGTRIQVAVRIRPLNRSDGSNEKVVVRVDPDDRNSVAVDDGAGRRSKSFSYDGVFVGDQREVYDTIGRPMLEEAYKGFNVCLFAYGQTGSGKTFSIQGDLGEEERNGIVPRFVRDMFHEAQTRVETDREATVRITMSMIEIYMERVRDLLTERVKGQEPESLELHEDANRKVYVKDVGVHPVLSYDRVMELLAVGNANRQTAETKMNETSSRSHSIVQFTIVQTFDSLERRDVESVVYLVDLAGSERQGKTETTGLQFEEAKKINQSLLMLGRALNSFSERRGDTFVSLRESKLTRLLSECFGGNSKTWMLATVSPSAFNLTETMSTLEYATNAKSITNRAEVNRLQKQLELKELKDLVSILEKKLEGISTQIHALEVRRRSLLEEEEKLLEAVTLSRNVSSTIDASNTVGDDLVIAKIMGRNVALKKRIESLQQVSRGCVHRGCDSFIGCCGVTLESVLLGERRLFSLSLTSPRGEATPVTLSVQMFPVGSYPQRRTVFEAVGQSVRFCINVVGASGLPAPFTQRSFCKYSLRYDMDDRWFKTNEVNGTPNPKWSFLKQFDLRDLTTEVVDCFATERVFVFEVFAFPE